MATRNAVTDKTAPRVFRSPGDLQPLPIHHGANSRQQRATALGDAGLAVRWLNAAKEAKATVSYARVMTIRGELESLRELLNTFQQVDASIDWGRAYAATGKEKTRLTREMKRQAAKYGELFSKARQGHDTLNKVLSKYVFRPGITYFATAHVWHFGMMSDVSGFQLKIGDRLIGEGDAVMALVRLASTRELGKVRPCEMCKERWLVALRSIDRFCREECREAFYVKSDEYKPRKAANQRKYREQLKRNGLA